MSAQPGLWVTVTAWAETRCHIILNQAHNLVHGYGVKMHLIYNQNKVLYKELIKPHEDFLLVQGLPLVLIELNGNFATDFKGSWKEPWGVDLHSYMCASAHQICSWKDCILVVFVAVLVGILPLESLHKHKISCMQIVYTHAKVSVCYIHCTYAMQKGFIKLPLWVASFSWEAKMHIMTGEEGSPLTAVECIKPNQI